MTTPHRTPTRSPRAPRPVAHRLRRLGLVAGVGAVTMLGLTASPAAANEFPPNPEATLGATCTPGPGFTYTLTNIGGLTPADFTIEATTVAGTTTATEQVAIDASEVIHLAVPEDTTGTVTITSQGMDPVTLTEAIDCFDSPTATITPVCGALGGAVNVDLVDPDLQASAWEIAIDGTTKTSDEPIFYSYGSLEEGEAWEAVVRADGVEVATQAGVVDCVQPAAEIELVCTDAGPDLLVRLHRDDQSTTRYEITWPETSRGDAGEDAAPLGAGDGPVVVHVEPGTDDQTLQWPLPREVGYSVSVSAAPDGLLADLEGSSGCPEALVLTADPVDVPTVDVTPVAVDTTWTPTTGAVRTTELARTGTETPYLVAAGIGLLGLGLVIVRLGRRMLAA